MMSGINYSELKRNAVGIHAEIPHHRKVIIYWLREHDAERVIRMMGLPRYRNINGKTVAYVDESDYARLQEYQSQNILRLVEHS